MAALLLDSLEVQRFRAFRHVQISHLGRVNLVVGNNKVGKTSLLEALLVVCQPG
ncbi:MAG: AAA family ATPase [Chloroflexaceae bacterium]|nr:AAA family ATPase [Chloroflexaceae bacterium]